MSYTSPKCLRLRRNHLPGFGNMHRQVFIVDRIQLNADPALDPHIRRLEICLWRRFDQHRLQTGRGGYPYRDMTVVVVVVNEHGKDLLATGKEGWCAMR